MKTKYFIPAMLLLMLVGCNKEQAPVQEPAAKPQQEQKGTVFAFSSSMGDVTKVTLNADNSLYWAAGDQIAVYDYKGETLVQSDVAALSGGEGTGVGTFTPANHTSNTDWFVDGDASDQSYSFYAFYPAPAKSFAAKVATVSTVAAEQKQSQGVGKYIVGYAASSTTKQVLASASAPNFAFAPKSALLKLTLRNNANIPVKISSIQISAASVNIAGDASLSLGTGVLSAGSGKVITYIPSSPIEIAAGAVASAPVYVSMLPCAPGSLTVTLNQAGFKYNAPSITLATIESGHVYAKEAAISSVSRELAISNGNSGDNLATASNLDNNQHYYGSANCVVMGYNDTQCILNIALKKSAGNFARSSADPTLLTAVNKAKVIWAEEMLYNDPNFCISAGNTNQLIINKTAGVTGNALIGIYRGDELLWSYHVWCPVDNSVVSATSEDGTPVTFQAYKLALGQILGSNNDTYMYYQWGRKDPMGRSASLLGGSSLETCHGTAPTATISRTGTDAVNNLAYARKNPTTWIMDDNVSPYDWYPGSSDVQNNDLWNSGAATFNDPCPQGYHVAPKELWAGLTNGSNGKPEGPLFESAGLWYVLGGYRRHASGGVNNVASYGYYWSSEVVPSQVNSYGLGFSSGTGLNREHNDYRAYGFGVRCVK